MTQRVEYVVRVRMTEKHRRKTQPDVEVVEHGPYPTMEMAQHKAEHICIESEEKSDFMDFVTGRKLEKYEVKIVERIITEEDK